MTFHKSCALLDEMSVSEPVFPYRKGTPERDQVWDTIALNLSAMEYPKFKVLGRSCRDRWRRRRKKAAKQIRKKAMERLGESSKDVGQMERWKWRRKRERLVGERVVAKLWSFSEKKQS